MLNATRHGTISFAAAVAAGAAAYASRNDPVLVFCEIAALAALFGFLSALAHMD